ncbi:TPA: hypothetical protein ACH3X3_004921 [Trebouxia sp. C0006]
MHTLIYLPVVLVFTLLLVFFVRPAFWTVRSMATVSNAFGTVDASTVSVCMKLFAQTALEKYYKPESDAGQPIPSYLLWVFTWAGRAQFVDEEPFFSIYNNPHNTPYVWQHEYIESLMAKATDRDWDGWTTYGRADALACALEKFSVSGKDVVVYGTEKPWVEAIALAAGASSVTTVEYSPIVSEYPGLNAMHPVTLAERVLNGTSPKWNVAMSYSSLEHSGLGRYGDRLNAFGDVEELQRMSCLLGKGDLLFLGLPVGSDQLVSNHHRVYGPHRLALLTAGWKFLAAFEENGTQIDHRHDLWQLEWRQPVMVFQNEQLNAPCHR